VPHPRDKQVVRIGAICLGNADADRDTNRRAAAASTLADVTGVLMHSAIRAMIAKVRRVVLETCDRSAMPFTSCVEFRYMNCGSR
jgi:hypothetical protein